MLKFRALTRPELWWTRRIEEWQRWLQAEIAALPRPDDFKCIEDWSRQDTAKAARPSPISISRAFWGIRCEECTHASQRGADDPVACVS